MRIALDGLDWELVRRAKGQDDKIRGKSQAIYFVLTRFGRARPSIPLAPSAEPINNGLWAWREWSGEHKPDGGGKEGHLED